MGDAYVSGGKRRWGFRARLTALIAGVFVTGGVVLLGVQYLLVRELFDSAIGTITGCFDDAGVAVLSDEAADTAAACATVSESVSVEGSAGTGISVETDGVSVFVEHGAMLSREVLSGLLLGSVVTLLGFTVIAVVVAFWLSRRSFARIGQITETTRRITHEDLHQRLDLPGPADEIKELGDTIDSMLDGLEASFTQQQRFITNASHELRTPLTTTRTALEIPLAQGQVPDHLEPAIRRALDANERSEHLIAALLQLAWAAHSDPGAAGSAVSLAALVQESLGSRRDEISDRHLAVMTDLAPATVAVPDPTLLALAVDNLVDNAIRHNPDHGTVRVSTGTTSGYAWVEITNSGPILDPAEAARLVEPFNRGAHTRTAGGGRSLGLGLTLVQNVADSLGAELTLTPGAGGGLVVRLSVPIARSGSRAG